jgi:exopolyphosphatase/guanosine-5'-triphosphate,3'-diphosphate pyrophosphatase
MPTPDPPIWAALDVGTNSVLLLVARAGPSGALEVLEDHCRMPRLGEGLARSGRIGPAAAQRALEVLEFFAQRLAALGQPEERTRAVGTAVLRRARNAAEFVAAARARTGLSIEILGEEEEARLGQLAVLGEIAPARAAIVDVGGGSTEFTSADGRLRLSIPVGAVVLAERFPRGVDFPALCAEARAAAEGFPARAAAGEECVLLGGTAVNLACLEQGFERFDHLRAEGVRLDLESARRWAERLAALPLERRSALPLEPERAAILPAGLACAAAALERLAPAGLRVSGRGLRYGVLRELACRPEGLSP